MINNRKAAIVGCGFVGAASAFSLMQSGLFSEMVLLRLSTLRSTTPISSTYWRDCETLDSKFARQPVSRHSKTNIIMNRKCFISRVFDIRQQRQNKGRLCWHSHDAHSL